MNTQEEPFTLLERYLAGDLSAAEAEAVDQQLATDPALAATYAELQLLQAGLAAYGRAEARARIRAIVTASPVRPLWRRPGVWGSLMAVAAALALLWLAVPWSPAPDSLHLEGRGEGPPPAPAPAQEAPTLSDRARAFLYQPVQDWDGAPVQQAVPTPGLRAFQAQDDAAVIRILADQRGRNTPLQQFMLGVSYLRTGELAQGQALLSSPSVQSRFPQLAPWYLALARLLDGQTEAARQSLEQIDAQQPPHPQREQARELLSYFPPMEFGL